MHGGLTRCRVQAVVRFAEEGSAQAVLGQLGALEEPLTIDGTRVTTSVLEGDEEAEYWKKLTAAKREKKGRTKGGQRGAQGQRGRGGEPFGVPSGGLIVRGIADARLKGCSIKFERHVEHHSVLSLYIVVFQICDVCRCA